MNPPDIHIVPDSDSTGSDALIERLAHTGSGVRVSLRLHDGGDASVLLTPEEAEQLELAEGQIVAVSVGRRAAQRRPSGSATLPRGA